MISAAARTRVSPSVTKRHDTDYEGADRADAVHTA